jgi:hypothetical protein
MEELKDCAMPSPEVKTSKKIPQVIVVDHRERASPSWLGEFLEELLSSRWGVHSLSP